MAETTLDLKDLPKDEALRTLGAQFIRGWQRTALGSAASALLTLLGPARTLTRLDRAIRTGRMPPAPSSSPIGEGPR